MGNKTIARKIALANKIPIAMGSEGNITNEEEAIAIAEKIGYPVIIKASFGRRREEVCVLCATLKKWKGF